MYIHTSIYHIVFRASASIGLLVCVGLRKMRKNGEKKNPKACLGGRERKSWGEQANKKYAREDGRSGPMEVVLTRQFKKGRSLHLPIAGLMNLGNTCFFNAVMQNLAQTQFLRRRLSEILTRMSCRFELLPMLSIEVVLSPESLSLTRTLAAFLEEMNGYGRGVLNPMTIFNYVCNSAPHFRDYQPQDSQELLWYLLGALKNEEVYGINRTILRSRNVHIPPNPDKSSDQDWKNICMYGIQERMCRTVVDSVFGGKLLNTITCRECRTCSRRTEDFLDLSLSIPSDIPSTHSNAQLLNWDQSPLSLEACLYNFCLPEILAGEDKVHCQKCTEKQNSSSAAQSQDAFCDGIKHMSIDCPPHVLCLHLKRLVQQGYSLVKDGRHVQFPLVLDLGPFCTDNSKDLLDSSGRLLYALYGVVEHGGSMKNGHYVARVRVPANQIHSPAPNTSSRLCHQHLSRREYDYSSCYGQWYFINDSEVKESTVAEVLRSQAYILFYERIPFLYK